MYGAVLVGLTVVGSKVVDGLIPGAFGRTMVARRDFALELCKLGVGNDLELHRDVLPYVGKTGWTTVQACASRVWIVALAFAADVEAVEWEYG